MNKPINSDPTTDRGGGEEIRLPHNATEVEALIFPILELYTNTQLSLPAIAEAVTASTGIPVKRTDISTYVRLGRRRRYVQMFPPITNQLTQVLGGRTNKGDVHVVPTYDNMAVDGVAARGAGLVVELIRQVAEERAGEVHLALGGGLMTKELVDCLVARPMITKSSPRVVIHMLGPAYSPRGVDSQATQLEQLVQSNDDLIHFHSAPLVPAESYDDYVRQPMLQRAFDQRDKIDIAISSFADSGDEHGHLRGYLEQNDRSAMAALKASKWKGEFQLNPFAASGPLQITGGLKPVTLFGIDEYVRMARQPGKHVLLLCAPCGGCKLLKTGALQPQLDQPALHTWNHLVVDVATARAVA